MGVDINTYRCRVGQFVPHHGAGGMCIGLNWSLLVNVIGAVFFIRILLIMAGVEQNPGPTEMFVFRYQYLLIEVGTEVLRKVFDSAVSNDFMRYLNAKPAEYIQLQYLINKDIISATQKNFLPPIDTKPSSSNFDISLLALLLRNVCGLSPRGDLVWTKPAPGDISTEADIARLRICRNNLQHQGKVFISKADFTAKWSELCQILIRLNKVAGILHLQSDIQNAEQISLDEKLEQKLKNVWQAWAESDRLLEERLDDIESELTTIKHNLVGVMSDVSTVKQDLVGVTSDVSNVKQDLVGVTSDVSTVKQDLVGVTSDVTTVKQDLIGVMSDVTSVKQDLVGVTSDVSNVKQDLVGVTSDVSTVKQDLVGVTSDVTTVKQDLIDVMSDVTSVKQDLVGVTSDVITVKQDLVGVTSDVTTVKQDLIDVTSDVSTVKQDLVGVTSDVTTVKQDLIGVTSDVTSVKQDLVGVTSDVTTVKQDLVGVTSDVTTVKQDLIDVTSDVTNVKQDLVGVTSDVTNVKQDVVGVTSDVSNVKQDLVVVKRKLDYVEQKKPRQHVEHRDIQRDLIEFYKRRCGTLPVSPLFDYKDENIMNIYKRSTMHSVEGTKQIKEILSFEEIFFKAGKPCSQIYITGDAGMGKTSFCTFMCSLWSMGKLGDELGDKRKELQKDVEYISKFDIVFYISLRDTECYDVIDMIGEQYLRHYDPLMIQDVLREQRCLVLMDGLDEWQHKQDGKKKYTLPNKFYSDNCVYITTSRPYMLERVRLSRRDVDHRVQITGIHGDASKSYVRDVIQNINKENDTQREISNFMYNIGKCDLIDQLCIPMLASHLVMLWFEKKLTDMPRALIYANILEMLFQRAKKRGVEFPPSTESTWQLPVSLQGLEHLKEHVSLLYNVCHLAFRSLFKQDEHVTSLVFTRQQLLSAPYCFSIKETDFMCAIGILSKNEVFGCFSKEKLKVSFIHKSYVEFFASLFTSSFDRDDVYSDATQSWKTLDDVLQFGNFFLLLAGLSYNKVKSAIGNVYLNLTEDLATQRRKSIFYITITMEGSIFDWCNALVKLQNVVINCYKEVSRSNGSNIELKLEDYIFTYDGHDICILKQMLLLNRSCVYSIRSTSGEFLDEFSQIQNVKCIHVGRTMGSDEGYDERFTELMLQNESTLHTVCIEFVGGVSTDGVHTPLPELPVRSLRHLTSLSLSSVAMQHATLDNLVKFLSASALMENVKLNDVVCEDHQICSMILNFQNHTKLTSLHLTYVDIVCHNVNKSNLKCIKVRPSLSSQRNNISYLNILNCVEGSYLAHLDMNGHSLDDNTMRTLAAVLNSLPCIKCLILSFMNFPDDVLLDIHPAVRQIEIELYSITMYCRSYDSFIESLVNKSVKVKFYNCTIISGDGETRRQLSSKQCMDYMLGHIRATIQTVNITHSGGYVVDFKTTNFQ